MMNRLLLALLAVLLAACESVAAQSGPVATQTAARPVGPRLAALPAPIRSATRTPLPTDTPLPTFTPRPTDTPVPTNTLLPPTATTAPEIAHWTERPLNGLSQQVIDYLATREGRNSAAVTLPSEHVVYAAKGDDQFHLASISKIVIMLTLLDQARAQGRDLTEDERGLLDPMIIYSWNDGATQLWKDIGGTNAIQAYLDSFHMTGIVPDPDGDWGASTASATAMAVLLGKLIHGEVLDESKRALAVDLISRVDYAKDRSGASAGLPMNLAPGWVVGLKDGYYQADDGWWINSVCFVIPNNADHAYAVAIMTDGQPSWEYGMETIETTARLLHASLGR